MKKIIISMMAAMMSVFSFAADDAIARITITGTTSGGSAQITLIENPSYSAGYDDGYDAPCIINLAEDLPKTLHIYSYIGANKYSTIATNNLDGLHVDFITNLLDDEYTMTFEVFTLAPGRTLDIYDLDEHVRKDIDPSESHTFTATKGHNEIKDRFIINYVAPALSVTTNDYGFCSFASSEDVEFATGIEAYKGEYNAGTNELTLTSIGQIVPAGTGVILYSTSTNTVFNYTTGADASGVTVGTNNFVGVTTAADPAGIRAAGKEIYCLNGNALKQYVGTDEIPAGKAYLPISVGGGSNNAPKHIVMRFNNTTAVENVEAEVKAEKFVEDGQVYIRRGNEVFNLQGQIVK